MYPPAGPTPLRSSITLVGWLLTILPSSLPFHVPSSSLNCDDLLFIEKKFGLIIITEIIDFG